jgi:putative transposase
VSKYIGQFPVRSLCRVMDVSSSGYYAWRVRPSSARSVQEKELMLHITTAHQQSRSTYGSPRVKRELGIKGISCSRNRVARLMRLHGVQVKPVRRFRLTTSSKHNLPIHANVLDRQFTSSAPDQRWASDMTYIWTNEGWLYLAVVMDLFSRRIVGWSTAPTLAQPLVLQALSMALQSRRPAAGLLHHSDRGSQYASHDYQEQLRRFGIKCSMSRKGNCWDNAVVESFFATLKTELIRKRTYRLRADAKADIFEYIEVWYNRQRRHSTLGYLSPAEFEAKAETNR